MNDEKSYIRKLEKLEPILGNQINGLLSAFHQGNSYKSRLQAGGIIDLLYQKYCLPDITEPDVVLRPPSKNPKGEIILGTISYRGENFGNVSVTPKDITKHIGVWGTTGSGKTNLAHILVDQLLKLGIPFTIFDWKQNFRSMLTSQQNENVLYFTVGSQISPFYWNPLEPPANTKYEDWLKMLIEAMKHALFLGHGVERILQEAFLEKAGDDLSNKTGGYPTFLSALKHLDRKKAFGREAMWLDSAKRALGAFTFGGIKQTFNVPFSIGPLLDVPVIYGLETLTDSEKTFFTEAICLWTYFHRLNQGQRKPLEHVFIMEEAHNILTRQKQSIEDRESLMDGILRQVRELGEGFVIIDQQPSSLTTSALANINTHFVFNIHNEADIRTICDSIGLHSEDRDYLKLLRPGEAIVKANGVARPFLVYVPESPRNSIKIADKQVSESMLAYSVGTTLKKASQFINELILTVRRNQGNRFGINQNSPQNRSFPDLSDIERDFLKCVAEQPNLGIKERYDKLGLSAYMGDKTKEQLLRQGLISQTNISTEKGRITILRLTAAGYELTDIKNPQTALDGDTEHEYWKRRIAKSLSDKGWTAEIEAKQYGRQYDILIRKNDQKRIIEVETGKGNITRTIEKLQESPYKIAILAVTNSLIEKKAAMILSKIPLAQRNKIILTLAHKL